MSRTTVFLDRSVARARTADSGATSGLAAITALAPRFMTAGAHLAAMMLAADWPRWSPDLPADLLLGAVCISGIYDLRPLVHAAFLQDDLRLDTRTAKFVSPVNYRPGLATPMITAVGADESAEFRRQNRLIRGAWRHCFRDDLPLPGRHHLASVEALGAASHPLFGATLRLLRGRS